MRKLNSYLEIRDWLETFIPLVYGKEELGLERIEELLKRLGNPQNKFKSIHVAGTSGKGSTAFYIARLLNFSRKHLSSTQGVTSKNLKVGLHVSPHLTDIRERMQIFSLPVIPAKAGIQKSANDWIPDQVGDDKAVMSVERFISLFNEIKPVVEAIQKEKAELTPSYFEILAAASFLYFAQEKVDFAVVEVGLGGRLDATNVLMPEVAVITNVGLDHTEILGETVEKIAAEKAGIVKRDVPIVTGASGVALDVIRRVAKKNNAPLVSVLGSEYYVVSIGSHCTSETANLAIKAVEVALSGLHPSMTQGVTLKEETIKEAFEVGFAGRFEEVEKGVILDGAHNPDKIKALIRWIKATTDKGQLTTNNKSVVSGQLSVVLVLAFKKGKKWKRMVDLLVNNLHPKKVYCTMFYSVTDTGKFASVEPKEIADYLRIKYQVLSIKYENSQEAVFEALEMTREVALKDNKNSNGKFSTSSNNKRSFSTNNLMVVTGSLYLVGEVRTMWKLPSFT